jgi:hypothetical protein
MCLEGNASHSGEDSSSEFVVYDDAMMREAEGLFSLISSFYTNFMLFIIVHKTYTHQQENITRVNLRCDEIDRSIALPHKDNKQEKNPIGNVIRPYVFVFLPTTTTRSSQLFTAPTPLCVPPQHLFYYYIVIIIHTYQHIYNDKVVARLLSLVSELNQVLSTKADAHSLALVHSSSIEKLNSAVDKIYEELAPKSYVEAVDDNQVRGDDEW